CYMEIICNTCGKTFTAKRSDAKYCSPRCRTQASRDRNQPDRPKRPRPALSKQFTSRILELDKVADALADLSLDDRMDRNAPSIGAMHRADLERQIDSLQKVL